MNKYGQDLDFDLDFEGGGGAMGGAAAAAPDQALVAAAAGPQAVAALEEAGKMRCGGCGAKVCDFSPLGGLHSSAAQRHT